MLNLNSMKNKIIIASQPIGITKYILRLVYLFMYFILLLVIQ